MKCVAIISCSVYSLFDDGVTLRSGLCGNLIDHAYEKTVIETSGSYLIICDSVLYVDFV